MNQKVTVTSPSEPKLQAILTYLSDKAGETVSRDELLENVWGKYGSDEALNQSISKLRKHLREFNLADAIETLPREGYRLTKSINFHSSNTNNYSEASVTTTIKSTADNENLKRCIENEHLKKENKLLKVALAVVLIGFIFSTTYLIYRVSNQVKIIKHKSDVTNTDTGT